MKSVQLEARYQPLHRQAVYSAGPAPGGRQWTLTSLGLGNRDSTRRWLRFCACHCQSPLFACCCFLFEVDNRFAPVSPQCSPAFAESDDVRGDPALSHQSAPAPRDARNSVVDAGGVESITQCSRQLPQMMAAGKCRWPSQDTNWTFHIVVERLPSRENTC